MVSGVAMGAIAIKKAAPVETKQATASDNAGSLVGTVLGLVSQVQQLNQQQKVLTEECKPTAQEVDFVNSMVKEWAKAGITTADEVERALGMQRCSSPSGGYQASVRIAAGADEEGLVCYDWFGGTANENMVWYQFPVVVRTFYCTDGSVTGSCAEKYKREVSNIYDVFNLIDFTEEDYTPTEATMAARLISKIEKCSYAKLNAKKRAMWGEFLVDAMGNVGQKTNTGTIMQTVSGVANTGFGGALQSLGGIATQFMDR